MSSMRKSQFEAIGTNWNIQTSDSVSDSKWSEVIQTIHERIQHFDAVYSRFRADSLVLQMSRAAGTYSVPPDAFPLLKFYEQLYQATDGKVTPLIGQVIADAGYDAAYSFEPKPLRQPPTWESILAFDSESIHLSQPALLDFGAAGKGYLVDIVSDLLADAKIRNFTINAGGDILHRSNTASLLEIGLENPLDTTEAVGVAHLDNRSLCASAGNKRKWGTFTHIIDPATLSSPQGIFATWVIADDTMTADGLATALFFTDAQKLTPHFRFTYAMLHHDMQLEHAADFPLTLFEAK